ncbi:hypothetical protein LLS47_11260 [Rouxiella badensis]|uniref:hypothetical protein n=1 Tax=Rouxiella badensis TaxID=1646377 RepID=UPI001D13C9B7|nr:hypothetical protein [Rouxiella badensis]MCC3733506.1 hypothetical protein [Rouxiella badensis]MCC3757843.1 hypothetical protein [Rouxiella badensis]
MPIRQPTKDIRTTGKISSSLNYTERQTLQDIAMRMRGANKNQMPELRAALDHLIGDRDLTAADARLIAVHAAYGAADGKTGETGGNEQWQSIIPALKTAE